jgi:SAM-dependent methyltransferase
MENKYNELAEKYQESDAKPDKLYSILPTVLKLVGDVENKTILDLGCGNGFFTRELARIQSAKVIGIDNSEKQIEIAKQQPRKNIEYIIADIFNDNLPNSDIVVAPFIINYPKTVSELKSFLNRLYISLSNNGHLVVVVDVPTGKDLKRYGASKKIIGPAEDEAPLEINLYNGDNFICTLYATYFQKETIQAIIEEVGFKNIHWHQPIVSEEGKQKYGEDFWQGYVEESELGYLTAEKLS